jgi:hypothetical protein
MSRSYASSPSWHLHGVAWQFYFTCVRVRITFKVCRIYSQEEILSSLVLILILNSLAFLDHIVIISVMKDLKLSYKNCPFYLS